MKVCIISLGCDKNLSDSEMMMSMISSAGYELIGEEDKADIIVVNTCAFVRDAKDESIDTLLRISDYKKDGILKKFIVTGCMAERYKDEITSEIPEVDAVIGTASFDKISEIISRSDNDKKINIYDNLDRVISGENIKRVSSCGHIGYLKIAEGCDKRCTYCIIPSLRGRYRSIPMDILLKQAKQMADGGVRELILVAQETTLYGIDIYKKKMLHELLEHLSEIDGIEWIRIMYCYPEEIYNSLIDTIAKLPKVCNYIDMPIQHCSDKILRSMGRKTSKSDIISIVDKLRDKIPDIVLRTTLISGFPGEDDNDHKELVSFVNDMKFDHLGIFEFSPEEGTKAYDMDNQVPDDIKSSRKDEIMILQQGISKDILSKLCGNNIKAIIDGYMPEDDIWISRTYRDAPDIDGMTFLKGKREYISGEIVDATIKDSSEYDTSGDIL